MKAHLEDWGRLAYKEAHERQSALLQRVIDGDPEALVFVEHKPVVTLGAGFKPSSLLLTESAYAERGIDLVSTGRGGDATFHGPGQLVIYPFLNLANRGKDVHRYLRDLERALIRLCSEFGVAAAPSPPDTGVWVGDRKIAAIGVAVRRWVTWHGVALNCDIDPAGFETIVPCGLDRRDVTSLSLEAGRQIAIQEAKPVAQRIFAEAFSLDFA